MDSGSQFQGILRSSAMRYQRVIGLSGILVFAALAAFSISVRAAWWATLVLLAFLILGLVGLSQSLTSSIEFDEAGIRARPYPWRPIDLHWREVSDFRSQWRGAYALVDGSRTPVLLLEYGHTRRQVRECRAAVQMLEDARTHYCD